MLGAHGLGFLGSSNPKFGLGRVGLVAADQLDLGLGLGGVDTVGGVTLLDNPGPGIVTKIYNLFAPQLTQKFLPKCFHRDDTTLQGKVSFVRQPQVIHV